MQTHQREFLELAIRKQVLRFGEFTLKSGRVSPYFFNAGLFDSGNALAKLGQCYAATLEEEEERSLVEDFEALARDWAEKRARANPLSLLGLPREPQDDSARP